MFKTIPRQEIEDRIKEIENYKGAPIKFLKRLSNPHEITSNTKDWYESAENYWEKKARKKLIVPIAVDKKYLARTLLIVDFLVKLIEFRGHNFGFDINDQNIIKILDREIYLSIRNVGKYVTNDDSKYSSRDFVMTEFLCVQMYEDTWNRKEWKDTPYSAIEEKLIRVVAYIELYAKYSHEYHLELKESWRKQATIREQEKEKQKKIEDEKREIEKLIMDAENFEKSQRILNYLNERKRFLLENNLYTENQQKYYEWGVGQSNLLNPLFKIEK
ncbi:hypothetical protein ACFQO9_01455 [Chryseobacterium zhengzhouense]|uniref:Uncharacterized protein n=1 Tax=Chryseobacterium zhengzhouense TaxID=1636086 RepID=A0ABW2LV39_9FLAO|nr:hypothetical protein [Chryseobacterium sp. S0630]MCP1299188.1 hypothetical protein [Chryseobacterium sp. S0630]